MFWNCFRKYSSTVLVAGLCCGFSHCGIWNSRQYITDRTVLYCTRPCRLHSSTPYLTFHDEKLRGAPGICLLEKYTGFIKLDEASYYVSSAPIQIIWWQVAAVCFATAIVCYLSLIIPTWIIKKVNPVKAIQFR